MNQISPQVATIGEGKTPAAGAPPSVWLGYAPTGGRVSMRLDEMKRRLLVGGQRSGELAGLIAHACRESDIRILVLDMEGIVSQRASGYMEHYDYTCFLHDAFRIEEEEATMHGQLIAAAYTAAMGLNSEEEAITGAALHKLSSQDSTSSPAVLFDALDSVDGFRGFYVDKLKGRVASLKFLEAAENGSFMSLLPIGGSIISFGTARYPQATELASAIFLAKLIAMLPHAKVAPDVVMVTGAHRIFGALPRVQHRERLLMEMLESRMTFILTSDQVHALSDTVKDAFTNKVLSSDAWNDKVETRWKEHSHDPILPNAFAIADGHFGHQRTFIARTFEPRFAKARTGPDPTEGRAERNEELTMIILDDIKRYEAPTKTSIIEFLAGEYGTGAVESELDRLFADGCIKLESMEPGAGGGGRAMLVYTITPRGLQTLE
ncbi:MAG: hypothetical protein OK454_04665, partial [Thaumarchaeota archaeon]|nr:hypothetical protein [Nitrososphaerota archaeon]